MSVQSDALEKTEEIEKIYQKYLKKIEAIHQEQERITKEFIQKMEDRKVEMIRNKIKGI